MEDEEKQIRDELSVSTLEISKENVFLFHNIDSFVALSRENTIVNEVMLYPFDSDAGNYEFWDKVGEIVGNLVELEMLSIQFLPYYLEDDNGDEARIPDWETLTRILRKLRRKVALSLTTAGDDYAEVEVMQGLARAIQGHPMISTFKSQDPFPYSDVALWCFTLATLTSLEILVFGFQEPETEDQRDSISPMSLNELLRMPALRFVLFYNFHFTDALCHATANAIEEGSSIVDITFEYRCSFPDGGIAVIADALKINASVTNVKFYGNFDGPLCNTLAAVLLCNSTLQNLTVYPTRTHTRGRWLSPIILSLGMNTTLKSLSVGICDAFGDELCVAIRNGLAKNLTLEKLSIEGILPIGDDGAVSARNALSFLRTNTTLKSLTVCFESYWEESLFGSAFRLEALKMMKDNPFLESLTITTGRDTDIKFEELLAIISALQLNTTLKTLVLYDHSLTNLSLTDDEVKQLVPILMKNYGLEYPLQGISCPNDRTVKAILRLNGAGRRYLIEDGSSISKGVEVLSTVSDDIECVFLHLLENPSLCDRRAAETTTDRLRPGTNLDESSS
jgi:hypothetical protein